MAPDIKGNSLSGKGQNVFIFRECQMVFNICLGVCLHYGSQGTAHYGKDSIVENEKDIMPEALGLKSCNKTTPSGLIVKVHHWFYFWVQGTSIADVLTLEVP